jgi:hypothetical protein
MPFVLLATSFVAVNGAQTEAAFPRDAEVDLVLTQSERAVQQYKPLIDQQEIQMSGSARTVKELVGYCNTGGCCHRDRDLPSPASLRFPAVGGVIRGIQREKGVRPDQKRARS